VGKLETLRAWREAIEAPFLEIIFEQRRSKRAALARSLLFVLSKIYQFGLKIYRFCIQARLIRDSTLGIQVIAIGNLTFGGTGKTPVVEKFARELQRQGRTVAILSRGYRSKPKPLGEALLNKLLLREDSTPPRVVSDGKNLLLDSDTAGDEPYMLASNLKDVVVLVDKNRVKSGRYAIEHSAATRCCWTTASSIGAWPGGGRTSCWWIASNPLATNICSRAALCASRLRTWRGPTSFSSPRATATPAALRERISRYNPAAGIIECIHAPSLFRGRFHGRTQGAGFRQGSAAGQPERHRAAGKFRAKPGQAVPRTGLFQTLRRPSPLHAAGNPQRHQPQQKAPGRGHHHHAKGRRSLPQAGPPRPAHLFHARGNQNPERAEDFDDCVRKICLR
jgi:tetraacyldisaccharide 4'-kinase